LWLATQGNCLVGPTLCLTIGGSGRLRGLMGSIDFEIVLDGSVSDGIVLLTLAEGSSSCLGGEVP
jgi:hypothetical protein